MEHIIAYNPYKNGNKGSVSSQPLSVYDKTIAYPWMADLVAAIRGGNDELKRAPCCTWSTLPARSCTSTSACPSA